MLMGSSLESSWNAGAVGDNGTSFGPFQIHLPAHPGVSAAQAQDPTFAAKYMLPAYQNGVSKVAPGLWQSNPALAAATAAYYAERPAKMYTGYDQKWSQVQAALNGANISGPVTGAAGGASDSGGSGGGGLDPFGIGAAVTDLQTSFTHGLLTLANMALFCAVAFAGGMLFLGGVAFIFWGSPMGKRAGEAVATGLSFAGPEGAIAGAVLRRGVDRKAQGIAAGARRINNRNEQQRRVVRQQQEKALQFKKKGEENG